MQTKRIMASGYESVGFYFLQEVTRAHKGWALDCVVLYNDTTRFFKDYITQPPANVRFMFSWLIP